MEIPAQVRREAVRVQGSARSHLPVASTTLTEYDSDGNRTKDIDGNGNATTYVYDVFHRKVQSIDPLGNISQTDYDKAWNVLAEWFFELQPDT